MMIYEILFDSMMVQLYHKHRSCLVIHKKYMMYKKYKKYKKYKMYKEAAAWIIRLSLAIKRKRS